MQSQSLSTRLSLSPLVRGISRWVFGAAGILWVAVAASLCGCSPVSPVNGWVMNESGKAYYKRGDYRAARQEFERALMDRPYSADYAFNVAAAMDQQGDHLAAEKMYRHAMTLDPGHQPSYHGLAAMMVEDGRTAEANDLVNTWAATQPYSAEAATELGWLKAEAGDLDGADRELRRALRHNPRHSRARSQLARVHGKSGRATDAAAEYARSLFMDPNQPDAKAELAALGNSVYGDPALQMAAAMPAYDPLLRPNPYPAFTSPVSQQQMASSPYGVQSWNSNQPQFTATGSGSLNGAMPSMGYSLPTGQAMSQPMPMAQSNWSQTQSMGMQPGGFPMPTYPDTVAAPYSTSPPMAQSYSAARPDSTFFQPQQSFAGMMPNQMTMPTQTPIPLPENWNSTPVANVQPGTTSDPTGLIQPTPEDAPAWNGSTLPGSPMLPAGNWTTAPAMNASYGTQVPAAQMSTAPVVPAF